jgi:hypothetical protein
MANFSITPMISAISVMQSAGRANRPRVAIQRLHQHKSLPQAKSTPHHDDDDLDCIDICECGKDFDDCTCDAIWL